MNKCLTVRQKYWIENEWHTSRCNFSYFSYKSRVCDDIGNCKTIFGTGFWVQSGTDDCFVTNRHNVDPTMVKSGETKKYKVHEIQIQLRLEATPGNWRPDTNFVTVGNLDTSIQIHETADAAILINPDISTREPSFGHSTFTLEELTTNEFLKNSVNLMDVASFVGFPGKDGKAWWDEEPTEGMFYHSGLSYFTRATAIKELLNA